MIMVRINNVQLKHNGILADQGTKLTLYVPECTDDQHLDLIKMAMEKTVGIIIFNPEELDAISEVLRDAADIADLSEPERITDTGPEPNEAPENVDLAGFIDEDEETF